MTIPMSQIAMDLGLPPSYHPDDFVVSSSNRLAYDYVVKWPQWDGPFLWIYGPPACGKTHLLHILAEKAKAPVHAQLDVAASSAELFGSSNLLILDNINVHKAEETLFHAINYAKEKGYMMVFSHRQPPARLEVTLPDLASRLRAIPTAAITDPDDVVLQAVMMKQLADRQLAVSSEVVQFILKRIDRSCLAVFQIVEQMDRASLEQGRTITLPFIKTLFTNL